MKINVSFLICAREINSEPVIAIENKNGNYMLPTFEADDSVLDIDLFVKDKFKEFTSFDARFKDIDGWVNLFICGTIVNSNTSSIVYACYLQETFEKDDVQWKSISSILENGVFEQDYTKQTIFCFNYFSR